MWGYNLEGLKEFVESKEKKKKYILHVRSLAYQTYR